MKVVIHSKNWTFALYRDWNKRQKILHILPPLSVFWNSATGDIQFSWLIWTFEIRWKDE